MSSRSRRWLYFSAAQSPAMQQYADPSLAFDVGTILLDCALRPEECFRLTWQNIRDGGIEIQYGKTDNSRRRIPMSTRVQVVLEMQRAHADLHPVISPLPPRAGT